MKTKQVRFIVTNCDPLSENPTCLHLHFMNLCCLEGKINGLLKFLIRSYSDRQQEGTINLHSAYTGRKIMGTCLIDHTSRAQWIAELGLVSFYLP